MELAILYAVGLIFQDPYLSVPYAVSVLAAACEVVNWFAGFMHLFMISSHCVLFIKWNRYVCDKIWLANICYIKYVCQ